MSNYEDMRDMQMREQQGGDYQPPALSFTAEDMADWDDDDREAAKHAMEKDMVERMRALETENAELRRRLAQQEPIDQSVIDAMSDVDFARNRDEFGRGLGEIDAGGA